MLFRSILLTETTAVVFISAASREQLYTSLKGVRSFFEGYYLILTDRLTLDAVSKRFYTLTQRFQNHTLLNRSSLILEEQIKVKLPVTYSYTEDDQKRLAYYISVQNKEEYLTLVTTILTENLEKRDLPAEHYQQFISLMCDQLLKLSKSLYSQEALLEQLNLLTDRVQTKAMLYSLFEAYYLHLTQDTSKKDMQHRFLDYIHAHYHEDISLVDMAATFNLAVNYVGVLFKEKTGYNFKDYLNTYRITMAKEQFTSTPTIKIKDLSAKVGFVNINTFIRIFKKHEGVSPGQYQKYLLDSTSQNLISIDKEDA